MSRLVVDKLAKSFPTRAEPLEVLREVSLKLTAGNSAAIVGPSGSGKSTLLHLIGLLDRPTDGKITLDDENYADLNDREAADFRGRKIGFVFQDHHLLPQLSALENVLLPILADGRADRQAIERGRELLQRVGLEQRLSHRPAELSGGERQRVAIARAMIRRPLLLLADEPTGNLDQATAASVADAFFEVQRESESILLIVTHSEPLARRCDVQYRLEQGRLVKP